MSSIRRKWRSASSYCARWIAMFPSSFTVDATFGWTGPYTRSRMASACCSLARFDLREGVERVIEGEQLVGPARRIVQRFVERHHGRAAPALVGAPAARRLDQHLAHGPRGDSLEVNRIRLGHVRRFP